MFYLYKRGILKREKSWPTRKEMGDERFLYYIEKRGNSTHTVCVLCVSKVGEGGIYIRVVGFPIPLMLDRSKSKSILYK
jgi:hypothetical protein